MPFALDALCTNSLGAIAHQSSCIQALLLLLLYYLVQILRHDTMQQSFSTTDDGTYSLQPLAYPSPLQSTTPEPIPPHEPPRYEADLPVNEPTTPPNSLSVYKYLDKYLHQTQYSLPAYPYKSPTQAYNADAPIAPMPNQTHLAMRMAYRSVASTPRPNILGLYLRHLSTTNHPPYQANYSISAHYLSPETPQA